MPEWLQELFDLMANERVRVEVTGEMGDVIAELAIEKRGKFVWGANGSGETFNDAMRDLMTNYAQQRA